MTSLYTLTGYPRSRTAWLANWLTWGSSWCYHEASRFAGTAESYRAHLRLAAHFGSGWIGNADSAVLAHPDWIPEGYPLVVVVRPEAEVVASMARFVGTKAAKGLMERLWEAMKLVQERATLVVDYPDLQEIGTLARVWETCLPGVEMPKARTLALLEMNVQVPYERRQREVACPG